MIAQYPNPNQAELDPTQKIDSQSQSNVGSSKKTGPYNSNFGMHLEQFGVYPLAHTYVNETQTVKPENWEDIKKELIEPRSDVTPLNFSESAWESFKLGDLRLSFRERSDEQNYSNYRRKHQKSVLCQKARLSSTISHH